MGVHDSDLRTRAGVEPRGGDEASDVARLTERLTERPGGGGTHGTSAQASVWGCWTWR